MQAEKFRFSESAFPPLMQRMLQEKVGKLKHCWKVHKTIVSKTLD